MVDHVCAVIAPHLATLVLLKSLPQGQDFRSPPKERYNCMRLKYRSFDMQHVLSSSMAFPNGCNVPNGLAEVI